MRIVCIGGGPAGLYFALLMKKLDPAHRITVVERNRPYDTFGWGVVFSDATMENMRQWDAETADAIEVAFNHWDDIELHFKGRCIRSGGHGFVGIGRKKLLNILQRRCEALGVELVFETEAESDADYPDADLVIASDGINSRIRQKYAAVFQPDIVARPNRFIWLGTTRLFDAFNFLFEKTEHGWFQAHVYKFDDSTTTFIVETPEDVWQASGLDQANVEQSIAFCERLFARHLQGHELLSNARHLDPLKRGSAWINFQRVRCRQWHHFNGRSHVVLMGDAVHTAHFAIGSGTKLALEDAIELTRLFKQAQEAGAGGGARPFPACWRNTRPRARSTCCGCRTRPGMRWSGSRWSARAIATSCRPSSSCTACSRAASASATKTCACATPPGWKVTSAGSPSVRCRPCRRQPAPGRRWRRVSSRRARCSRRMRCAA